MRHHDATWSQFHPAHAADLQRSGLRLDTVIALGIASIRPNDIPKLIGFDPTGVDHALQFPYLRVTDFCRLKVWPGTKDRKYLQKKGSSVHLYLPPLAQQVLEDPTHPLGFVEGEKKALKACQEGIPCIGLGGLWNFTQDGRPIEGLNQIPLLNRQVTIYADSNVWGNPHLQQAVYAFGRLLEHRGAVVTVAVQQPYNGQEDKLDDYLVRCVDQQGRTGPEAVAALERIPLDHTVFSEARAWYPYWLPKQVLKYRSRGDLLQEIAHLLTRVEANPTAEQVYDYAFLFAYIAKSELSKYRTRLKTLLGKALDLNQFDALVREARKDAVKELAKHKATGPLPVIIVNHGQLRDITDQAMQALHQANNHPVLFQREKALARIHLGENGMPSIEAVDSAILTWRLARVATWCKITADETYQDKPPPQEVVTDILALGQWPFPLLQGITTVPIVRPDGSLLLEPGYDASTKLLYHPPPGFSLPAIPSQPTTEQLTAAKTLLLEEYLVDFPFVDDSSKAHTIALLLTPLIRRLYTGTRPLIIVDKPRAGTGATLLTETARLITIGSKRLVSFPHREEEQEKRITTLLLQGEPFVILDNVKGKLWSAPLEEVLTSTVWQGRVLGKSEMPALPQEVTWCMTANNLTLDGDLPRRCLWIRLDAKHFQPWERPLDQFQHPDLESWVLTHRGELLQALFVLIRHWIAHGSPTADVPILGGFPGWSATVGGILQHAEIAGFLDNRQAMYAQMDIDAAEWEAFFTVWFDLWGDTPQTVKDVHEALAGNETFLEALPSALSKSFDEAKAKQSTRSFRTALGNRLKSKRDSVVTATRLQLQDLGRSGNATLWKLHQLP